MPVSAEVDLRALDLFGRLTSYPGNARFRERLLRRESAAVLARLSQIEAGHLARAAMPTEMPDWAAAALVEPPGRIGPFLLTQRIGRGGMGDVWRGERDDGLFEQVVAIKLIQANLHRDAKAAFEKERRILARLDHPDIVRLTDGGATDDGLPYLIMDYVEGVAFDVAVAPLGLDQRIRLFIQAANVVQFAHSRLVAHADLKPSNILVDVQGRVRLLDFGIAGLLDDEGTVRAPIGALTREFASPERLAGAPPSIVDDVYALGKLLKLVVRDAADGDLRAVIARAHAESEASRYGTVAMLVTDLVAWRNGMSVSAQPDRLRYHARKFVQRHKVAVTATALALCALVTTTLYATASSIRAENARAEATARYADAHGIAHYLIFDVMQRLENQPHSLALRSTIAQTAQLYLNRLSQLRNADTATKLDTATGLWQLAAYQGKPGFPNLDKPDAARASLESAAKLARQLSEPAAEALFAHILLDWASIAANTDSDLPTANRLLAEARPVVMRASGTDPGLLQDYFHRLANVSGWHERYADEVAASRSGLALKPLADPEQDALMRDWLLDSEGEGLYYLRERAAALGVYRQQMRIDEAARQRWPAERVFVNRLIGARVNVGSVFNVLNRFEEALPVLEKASAEAQANAVFEPADQWAMGEWQSADATRAQALAGLGRFDEAIEIDKFWVGHWLKVWQNQPGDLRRMRFYAQTLAMTGEAQGLAKRFSDECRTDALSLNIYDQIDARGRLTAWDKSGNVAELKQRISRNCTIR